MSRELTKALRTSAMLARAKGRELEASYFDEATAEIERLATELARMQGERTISADELIQLRSEVSRMEAALHHIGKYPVIRDVPEDGPVADRDDMLHTARSTLTRIRRERADRKQGG